MSKPAWISAIYDTGDRAPKSHPYTVITTSGHIYLPCVTLGYRTQYIGHVSSMPPDWLVDNLAVGDEVDYDILPADIQTKIRAIRDRLWKDEQHYEPAL